MTLVLPVVQNLSFSLVKLLTNEPQEAFTPQKKNSFGWDGVCVASLEKLKIKRNADMELLQLIHDLVIVGGCIAFALLPRIVVALAEAKANDQERAKERV